MARTELDEFNEREVPQKKEVTKVTWEKEEFGMSQEAACAICDALFSAPIDRPPIFCPSCKQGLAEVLQL